MSGYWRLLMNGEVYYDDSYCEEVNASYDEAEAYYVNMLLEDEVPESKKELRCGVWFLKKQPVDITDMQWRDDESHATFIKRVTERLYRLIGCEYECKSVRYISGSSISRYYRTGESVRSESCYVYEIDKEGNKTRID